MKPAPRPPQRVSQSGERQALIREACALLERDGPTNDAEHAVASILETFPRDAAALRLHAHIATQRDDAETALKRWLAYFESATSADIEAYETALRMAKRCADAGAAERIIGTAPPELMESVAFRCRVWLPFFLLRRDIAAGLCLLASVPEEEIGWHEAVSIGEFLDQANHHEEALVILAHALERHPGNWRLIRRYLIAAHHVRGPKHFVAEKARLFAQLPAADIARVLLGLRKNWLTHEEIMRVVANSLASQNSRPQMSLAVEILGHNDADAIAYFAEHLADGKDAPARLVKCLLVAKARGTQRLAANPGDVKAEARSLSADIEAIIAAPSGQDQNSSAFRELSIALQRTARRAHTSWLNSGESHYDAAQFADWLGARIARREPTALIRLSDGEGNFLPYTQASARFQNADQSEIQQHNWWGGNDLSAALALRFMGELATIAARADAVGAPPMARLLRIFYGSTFGASRGARGVAAVLRTLDGFAPGVMQSKVLVSCQIHADLDHWNLYRRIFQFVTSVSIVACHDLSTVLKSKFGLSVRNWHVVPPPVRYRSMFGEAKAPAGEAFYPTVFERIMSDVAPQPGEVFLVGAGFLGKFLCDRIRERGGIALDIGSVADYWMGYSTRIYAQLQR